MIRPVYFLILAASLCATGMGNEAYREFSYMNGTTVRAKPVSFDAETGTITLEQENGLQTAVLPTAFSERDRAYMNAWIEQLQRIFSDLENYTISVKMQTDRHSPFTGSFNEVSFRVNIINKSGMDFGKIRTECCFFINRTGYGDAKDVMYCETRSCRNGPLQLAGTLEFETGSIKIHHRPVQYYQRGSAAMEAYTAEEVAGLIVRIYRAGDDEAFLEFSEPRTFLAEHEWNEFPQRDGFGKKE